MRGWLHELRQTERRRTVNLAIAAGAAALAASCAALPPHTSESQPPPQGQARARVTVVGAQGPVAAHVKQRDLERLQAEGRAESVRRHLDVLASLGASAGRRAANLHRHEGRHRHGV